MPRISWEKLGDLKHLVNQLLAKQPRIQNPELLKHHEGLMDQIMAIVNAAAEPRRYTREFSLDNLRMGHFALYESTGQWVHRKIEKQQLKSGIDPEAAKFVHIDVLGGGPFAVRVNPPRTKVIDVRQQYAGHTMAVVRYKGEEFDERLRYKVAFWAATHCNLRYDYLGVLRFRLGSWFAQRRSTYFCSENAAWALQKEFPNALKGMKPEDVMPAHFLNPLHFEIVWSGRLPK